HRLRCPSWPSRLLLNPALFLLPFLSLFLLPFLLTAPVSLDQRALARRGLLSSELQEGSSSLPLSSLSSSLSVSSLSSLSSSISSSSIPLPIPRLTQVGVTSPGKTAAVHSGV